MINPILYKRTRSQPVYNQQSSHHSPHYSHHHRLPWLAPTQAHYSRSHRRIVTQLSWQSTPCYKCNIRPRARKDHLDPHNSISLLAALFYSRIAHPDWIDYRCRRRNCVIPNEPFHPWPFHRRLPLAACCSQEWTPLTHHGGHLAWPSKHGAWGFTNRTCKSRKVLVSHPPI